MWNRTVRSPTGGWRPSRSRRPYRHSLGLSGEDWHTRRVFRDWVVTVKDLREVGGEVGTSTEVSALEVPVVEQITH